MRSFAGHCPPVSRLFVCEEHPPPPLPYRPGARSQQVPPPSPPSQNVALPVFAGVVVGAVVQASHVPTIKAGGAGVSDRVRLQCPSRLPSAVVTKAASPEAMRSALSSEPSSRAPT